MTYQEAVSYLEQSRQLGSRPGLDSIKALLARMGNPERQLQFIHIAGTNGKGSTGSFFSHILVAAGYRVGFFSSPAVYHLCESMKLNNQNISKDMLAKVISTAKAGADQMELDGLNPPTEFEILTASAYAFFQQAGCDYVIAECGMGGRLDATNVMEQTLLSVLCRIDYDHVDFLGNTLADITKEKCGILRKKRPVVVYPIQNEEVFNTIAEAAKEKECPIYVPDLSALQVTYCNETGSLFSYGNLTNLNITMLGQHQVYNAVVALEGIRALTEHGIFVPETAIRKGLSSAGWTGRFEVLSKEPTVILDGAHNLNGVKAFVKAIKTCYPKQRFIGVVGMLKDKDYQECLAEFAQVCDLLILTEVHSLRTATVFDLEEGAKALHIPTLSVQKPEEAVKQAFLLQKSGEGIFCAGSLYNLSTFKDACFKIL